uniref:Uncharacterized protein n=1 Tax=Nelumbo nucifera TaxID=4432 RepID=A0A822Y6R7_NELNU|nr:TPA_asm: hypothetical protein HUJ06_029625 [Nelumbo nucifera]
MTVDYAVFDLSGIIYYVHLFLRSCLHLLLSSIVQVETSNCYQCFSTALCSVPIELNHERINEEGGAQVPVE